ncbi:hypothetical protein ACFYZB_20150 [Streptomyces sp. NPDC001852]|uniref:hypothetical protein n=1 Tax=Streptomyces sp. NPDC001852 TaxID=3364619 RepID=UPI0036C88C27
MTRAVELAVALGAEAVDEAQGMATVARRFADDDLPSVLDHLASAAAVCALVVAGRRHSVRPGTLSWRGFGR